MNVARQKKKHVTEILKLAFLLFFSAKYLKCANVCYE